MKKKILVVEDDTILRNALEEGLKGIKDIDILLAKDGKDGLEQTKKHIPDVILLDILMPKMNGVEVLEKIRKNDSTKDIPVFIISVVENEESIARCVQLGIKGYFIKSSYSLESIVQAVKKYV
ncbi:MAG: response regulator [Candidatus Magasanikbacteria bacterium]